MQVEYLRSYRTQMIGHRNYDCFLWEAARATTAAPLFFEPVELTASKTTFSDGAVRANNPIDQLASEARRLWPERSIGCLVSLGTGIKGIKGFDPKKSRLHEVLQSLAEITTDAHTKHLDFRDTEEGKRLRKKPQKYFRFSVQQGMDDIDLAEFEEIPYMEAVTLPYARGVDDEIEECARNLAHPTSIR
jgi:predicted acylesterase/phospholipase RssA